MMSIKHKTNTQNWLKVVALANLGIFDNKKYKDNEHWITTGDNPSPAFPKVLIKLKVFTLK